MAAGIFATYETEEAFYALPFAIMTPSFPGYCPRYGRDIESTMVHKVNAAHFDSIKKGA